MTYDDAKKAAVENGRLIKRKCWTLTSVGYDRVRGTFFIQVEGYERHLYMPTMIEKEAKDWVFA